MIQKKAKALLRLTEIFLAVSVILSTHVPVSAQDDLKPNLRFDRFYFYFGYNRVFYTRSDIKINDGNQIGFTLSKVKGEDPPLKGLSDFKPFTDGPYNIRMGYYLTPRYALSIGFDHMRYRIRENQTVAIKGEILDDEAEEFKGNYSGEDIVLTRPFFYLEHTDGLNYISVEQDFRFLKSNTPIQLSIGSAAGMYWPRTESFLFGRGGNHPYHISGWGISIHSSIGYIPQHAHFFGLLTAKGGHVRLNDILLDDRNSSLRASQIFFFLQVNLGVGFKFL
jgi:hypothetical protein